ncbi:hypothetical protein KY290_013890 [Solanum tuberosum]|uniref:Endonuclease/exonuclease/phosphatase n=1 Tax=Solanum tuberosum TaxID=4113 RepID=A0ABQ7UXR6_SOLTU|nr:hypothetical protein KY284_025045 [Solanum tuberosum]KAH0699316.1 hypothetical protein KY284_013531 [Solanum tuberosum]KAH0755931.1 hypothetical protein KY290_026201 [Solanum tuberosum]KAH0769909.1 hypothetical protein KY290_013890 [Solanum tuberosum]
MDFLGCELGGRRCSVLERLELWENLEAMAGQNYPWLVGGDFNTIVDETEKLGGLPVTQSETHDFIQCIDGVAVHGKYIYMV